MNRALFSSASDEWSTPQPFFDRLNARWQFTLDVCATPENTKCEVFFASRGLEMPWAWERCWMNPPYGREIGRWVMKAALESRAPETIVVALLPARTDTRWWGDWVAPYARVTFIRGRLKFGGAKSSAPFPSALAVYPKQARPPTRQLHLFAGGAK